MSCTIGSCDSCNKIIHDAENCIYSAHNRENMVQRSWVAKRISNKNNIRLWICEDCMDAIRDWLDNAEKGGF